MSYRQCSATSKRTGKHCKARAVRGKDVCYHHGGKSNAGAAVPTFKDGRYSRYLPERLAERYQEASSDAELLAMREDIALIDARLGDLISRVDTGESGSMWKALQKAWKDYLKARAGGKSERVDEAFFVLEDAIEKGATDYEAWREIGQQIEQRRRLAESERKRLIEMRQMVRTDQAMVLVSALVATVRKHVHDPDTLAAISADVGRLMVADGGRSTGGAVPA